MKVHLVRHARASRRTGGEIPGSSPILRLGHGPGAREDTGAADARSLELLRPLNDAGRAQAEALVEHFLSEPPRRLLAGPALRCQHTLEPLAMALGLAVEVDDRLGEAEPLSGLSELVAELGDEPAVLCTHAPPIRGLLDFLGHGNDSEAGGSACRKGSIWTLEGPGGAAIERASYLELEDAGRPSRGDSKLRLELVWPSSLRAAVLDMGSTSFTLLVADVTREAVILPVVREKVMLRLGAAVASCGKIPGALAREAGAVASALRQVAAAEKVDHFVAVATAALRDTHNGPKIVDKIACAIGAPVHILEGEAEARLMFRAFQARLSLGVSPVLGLDLGGGSLELAVGCGRRIDHECTLPLGAVRLKGELVTSDPMRARDARRLRERVRQEIAPHRDALLRRRPGRIVAAGGTPRALARLVAAQRGQSSAGDALPMEAGLDELRRMSKRLVRSAHEERLAMPETRRRRSDLLATAAVVLVSVAETLDLDHLTFCDWGLREGVLLDLMKSSGPRVIERA